MTAAEPAIRRRQLVLGLALGAAWLLLVVLFIIIFSGHGLPKNPQEWKRLQQLRAADGPSTGTSTP